MHPTTYNAKAYSAASATSPLASTKIKRRDPTDRDVQIEILFCGICHPDLHSVRNEWSEFMATNYPIVPGHEIVGRVTKVGSAVTKYNPGGSRRGRLHGRLGRHLPTVQGWPRAILPEHDPHLQLSGQAPRRRDLRWLLRQHCCRRTLRFAHPIQS